jgi:hypothetical protein
VLRKPSLNAGLETLILSADLELEIIEQTT